ncbi:hypothetical protein MAR_016843 [Mya arenaria]|uniref:Uncharacterized protein n=1 Tax=Mya arenaria TaxID=6604 RepID=A0ABY7EAL3_MYAAR|nr:hypothetical protein MAR_016843 [Mya arenaria]
MGRSMRSQVLGIKYNDAIGVIDGTSHELYRSKQPQQPYYSSHRHSMRFTLKSSIVRHVGNGCLAHIKVEQQFTIMQQAGIDLPSPEECLLEGDKIYPDRGHLMTPYTTAQLARKGVQRKKKMCKIEWEHQTISGTTFCNND